MSGYPDNASDAPPPRRSRARRNKDDLPRFGHVWLVPVAIACVITFAHSCDTKGAAESHVRQRISTVHPAAPRPAGQQRPDRGEG